MGYDTKKLSLLVQDVGGGQSLWAYYSADSIATILGASYVSDASSKGLKLGDFVMVVSGTVNTAWSGSPSTADYGDANTVSALSGTELAVVSAISSGAATLQGRGASDITDNSGGVANAATGVVANAFKQTFIMPVQLADIANAGVWKLAVPFAFTLSAIGFRTGKPASTASKLATLTAQVNGVAVTGGVAALTTANQNATGTLLAGSAITAGNTGTAGQTIEAAASSVTAFVEGDGWIEFTVVNNDLANAIATLIKF